MLCYYLGYSKRLGGLAPLASYDGSEDASSVPGVSRYGIGSYPTACLEPMSQTLNNLASRPSLASGAGSQDGWTFHRSSLSQQ